MASKVALATPPGRVVMVAGAVLVAVAVFITTRFITTRSSSSGPARCSRVTGATALKPELVLELVSDELVSDELVSDELVVGRARCRDERRVARNPERRGPCRDGLGLGLGEVDADGADEHGGGGQQTGGPEPGAAQGAGEGAHRGLLRWG